MGKIYDVDSVSFDETFINSTNKAVAYVDGSFNPEINCYAFGAICFSPDGYATKIYGCNNNPLALKQRNVSGEMIAAMRAVTWAIKEGYSSIELRYDYQGIEAWVTGAWKAKNSLTQKYSSSMRDWNSKISISFSKVLAHSSDFYNEIADRLAKKGLSMEIGKVYFD